MAFSCTQRLGVAFDFGKGCFGWVGLIVERSAKGQIRNLLSLSVGAFAMNNLDGQDQSRTSKLIFVIVTNANKARDPFLF